MWDKLGYTEEELESKKISEILYNDPLDRNKINHETFMENLEKVIKGGEQKDTLMVIEEGQVEVSKGDLSLYAEDQKVATISGDRKFCDIFRGDILGEMSLIDVEPASATVRAVTKVGIWSMKRVDFAAVLRKDLTTYIVVITNIARILSRRLRDAGKIDL